VTKVERLLKVSKQLSEIISIFSKVVISKGLFAINSNNNNINNMNVKLEKKKKLRDKIQEKSNITDNSCGYMIM